MLPILDPLRRVSIHAETTSDPPRSPDGRIELSKGVPQVPGCASVGLRGAWNSKETVDSISALRSNRVKMHNSKNGGSVGVERKWQRRWSVAAVLVVASMIGPGLAIAAREKAVKSLTADFEQSTTFQEWRVGSGAESSAARATLTPGPGHSGRGAILQYEIPCNSGSDCPGAVAAQWTPRSAMPV